MLSLLPFSRTSVSFFLFGVFGTFVYVVMLSAAKHIEGPSNHGTVGIILICDIVPALAVKLLAPVFLDGVPFSAKVVTASLSAAVALHVVSAAEGMGMRLVGVCGASFSFGLAESSFLALTARYEEMERAGGDGDAKFGKSGSENGGEGANERVCNSALTAYSLGTGAAGLFGSGAYLLLNSLFGLGPKGSLVGLEFLPFMTVWIYFGYLDRSKVTRNTRNATEKFAKLDDSNHLSKNNGNDDNNNFNNLLYNNNPNNNSTDDHHNNHNSNNSGNGNGNNINNSGNGNGNNSIGNNSNSNAASKSKPSSSTSTMCGAFSGFLPTRFAFSSASNLPYEIDEVKVDKSSSHSSITSDALMSSAPVSLTTGAKLRFMRNRLLVKYMLPNALLYIATYTVNQGCAPSLHFGGGYKRAYELFYFMYSMGSLFGRGTSDRLRFVEFWPLALFQVVNLVLIIIHAVALRLFQIWSACALFFFVGFLAGLMYVHLLRAVAETTRPAYRPFALSICSVSSSVGALLAGVINMPMEEIVHNTEPFDSGTEDITSFAWILTMGIVLNDLYPQFKRTSRARALEKEEDNV